MNISQTLDNLRQTGNFRTLPQHRLEGLIDLSSNDYLGLAQDIKLRKELFDVSSSLSVPLSSSASRLLSAHQEEYILLEELLESLYPKRRALIFNSGYHANTGLISALADRDTLIIADRLVHASIIDGITLSRAKLIRFRHNDLLHLQQILEDNKNNYSNILIITESVFSMDGDQADLKAIIEIKDQYANAYLYVDEAHAFGVLGPQGRGLVAAISHPEKVDIVVGTFGKALASIGAFAVMNSDMRDFMINKARSLIFSTALPPINMFWTRLLIGKMLTMDKEREHLHALGKELAEIIGGSPSHIQPLIIGDAKRAVEISNQLLLQGIKVLPIRTPTVPPGTERLRFSLSAAIDSVSQVRSALEGLI